VVTAVDTPNRTLSPLFGATIYNFFIYIYLSKKGNGVTIRVFGVTMPNGSNVRIWRNYVAQLHIRHSGIREGKPAIRFRNLANRKKVQNFSMLGVDNVWIKTIMVGDETSTVKSGSLLKEYAQGQCIRKDHCVC
jgi:hypothetical protein